MEIPVVIRKEKRTKNAPSDNAQHMESLQTGKSEIWRAFKITYGGKGWTWILKDPRSLNIKEKKKKKDLIQSKNHFKRNEVEEM